MGRKASLTDKQQKEILKRSLEDNEGSRAIAAAMKLPETTVRRYIMAQAATIKSAGNQIVTAERKILDLPIVAQVAARDYMATLRAISDNLATAAAIGTSNAAKLAKVAEREIEKATISDEIDIEGLKIANGLTRSANDAAQIGMQLLQANKDRKIDQGDDKHGIDVSSLSPQALAELMRARNASIRK